MANQKNPYGSFPKMPYKPGTGRTVPIPNYVPGTGTAKTMPYRPAKQISPVTKAAKAINSIDTRDVFEKVFESPFQRPSLTKTRKG